VFTLEGGVQAYFDEYGDREDQRWDDHLFVFDSRLAMTPKGLPASEAGAEAATLECHCCKERSAPPPHRNCPNVDCNRLFLVCPACVSKLVGFC
jgi:predicted sulfurtransferase